MALTALVLSGGGMFGAYQAGVWAELEDWFQPDIVIGASVGSLNGWAVAGGITGPELIETWLHPERAAAPVMRFPRSWRDGVFDPTLLESWIQTLYRSFRPQRRIAIALTEMWNLQPVLIQDGGIQWQHLAASCAVPGFLPQYRIDGHNYADGGLLQALPLWAAARVGATHLVGVNLLPAGGSSILTMGYRALQRVANSKHAREAVEARSVILTPDPPLGPPTAMIRWERERVEKWIERGRIDTRAKKHFVCDMF